MMYYGCDPIEITYLKCFVNTLYNTQDDTVLQNK